MRLAGSLLMIMALSPTTDETAITGTASYRERIMVSPQAVFEATLEDVSRADAPAVVLARQRLSPAGGPPYQVRIPYDPSKLDPKGRYVVRATLTDGPMSWGTDTVVPVLRSAEDTKIQLLLKRRGAPPRPTPRPARPTGTFEGTLPCADCPGVKHTLALFPDGAYYLRREYEGRPGTFDEVGRAALSSDGKTLALAGGREAPTFLAVSAEDRLTALDREGEPISTSANLDLVRVASPAPLEPRLELVGSFTSMADSPAFVECLTRRRLPVAMEADFRALEKAYLALPDRKPGAPALARVEGRIVERVNMEGPKRPMLVVERFVSIHPGESCPPRFDTPPLEGTHWRLTQVDGEPVVPKNPARRPHLVFGPKPGAVAGSDGCNRLMGTYETDGSKMKLGPLAGTMMACPDVAPADAAFRKALAATVSWRALGPHLELFDASGRRVARFEAAPPPAPR
jgi:copper homeostasis protein (lipoprotein)